MRLHVPFHTNNMHDCGTIALQMVLEFLGVQRTFEEIHKAVDSEESGVTLTIGLARAAAKLGCNVEFYTTSLGFDTQHMHLEFYKEMTAGGDALQEKTLRLAEECKELGVQIKECTLTREEILQHVSQDCVPIVLFDWSVFSGKNGFLGHFMPIVGHDDTRIYAHQPGPKDPTPFFAMSFAQFDSARTARGTDQDVLFISRRTQNL